ncbi:uncharacterized protein At5g65660-like [Corylus avellana]|uniref:uncharacterized protein At5g65660-like n=1 Tax=Corylus avellana TaxID=13451 RepID=UPI00286BF872|nr:uncharacterized protein At5g65660-like [Corylus avellana]
MADDESSSRPSIGFPLGLALLLMMLFFMSAFFSCCLHWDKLRSLLHPSRHLDADLEADIKPLPPHKMPKQEESQSFSVLMPGDQVPKFIAMACPCRPPIYEKAQI